MLIMSFIFISCDLELQAAGSNGGGSSATAAGTSSQPMNIPWTLKVHSMRNLRFCVFNNLKLVDSNVWIIYIL